MHFAAATLARTWQDRTSATGELNGPQVAAPDIAMFVGIHLVFVNIALTIGQRQESPGRLIEELD